MYSVIIKTKETKKLESDYQKAKSYIKLNKSKFFELVINKKYDRIEIGKILNLHPYELRKIYFEKKVFLF
jgi:hypothetical protein